MGVVGIGDGVAGVGVEGDGVDIVGACFLCRQNRLRRSNRSWFIFAARVCVGDVVVGVVVGDCVEMVGVVGGEVEMVVEVVVVGVAGSVVSELPLPWCFR